MKTTLDNTKNKMNEDKHFETTMLDHTILQFYNTRIYFDSSGRFRDYHKSNI